MDYFDFEIMGLKRKLPYVKIGENLALASFVVLSDTELIQTVAPELLGIEALEKAGLPPSSVDKLAKGNALRVLA